MSDMDVLDGSTSSGESSLGQYLKEARTAAGYSIEEVSQSLRFSVSQLKALEEDRYEDFSSRVYLQGIVKNYGKFLNVDLEQLNQRLKTVLPADVSPVIALPYTQEKFESSRHYSRWFFGVIVLSVLIGGGVFVYKETNLLKVFSSKTVAPVDSSIPVVVNEDSASQSDSIASSTSMPLTVAQPASEPKTKLSTPLVQSGVQNGKLSVSSDQAAWVEIRDNAGKKLVSQIVTPGSPIEVPASKPLNLKIGKASHVVIKFGEQPIDLAPYIKGEVAKFTLN